LQAHLPRICRSTENCAGTIGQPLAHVLAHALHRLAAFTRGVLGLDALVYTWQMLRQGLAPGLALLRRLGRCWGWFCRGLQRRELLLQVGLVGGQGLAEQFTLFGTHALGAGTELPGLQPRELERDLLDLGVAPLDGLGR
jgi:hypothetical protein